MPRFVISGLSTQRACLPSYPELQPAGGIYNVRRLVIREDAFP